LVENAILLRKFKIATCGRRIHFVCGQGARHNVSVHDQSGADRFGRYTCAHTMTGSVHASVSAGSFRLIIRIPAFQPTKFAEQLTDGKDGSTSRGVDRLAAGDGAGTRLFALGGSIDPNPESSACG
jgi:hypothetical protein